MAGQGMKNLLDLVLEVGGDPADLPFWEACEEGAFLVHTCTLCQRSYWPASRCVNHGDASMQWQAASGKGTLHTYTIMHRSFSRQMKDRTPYVVGVVRLEEGPFFHANIIECQHDQLKVGMQLEVAIQKQEGSLSLPMFRPAD